MVNSTKTYTGKSFVTFLVCVLGLLTLLLPLDSAHSAPVGFAEYLHATAQIDGEDYFELTGNTWRWEHIRFVVPEQHSDPYEPTIVNGQEFLTDWPSGQGWWGTYSAYNTVQGLSPIESLYGPNVEVWFEFIRGRSTMELSQAPSATNDYTTRVHFYDAQPSHSTYEFKLWAKNPNPVPIPGTVFLVGSGLVGCLARLRKGSRNR
ncbi:MAG: hypothetical protein V1736_08530 [Pseudomonadota bacterium]